jgi:hypothetical protein
VVVLVPLPLPLASLAIGVAWGGVVGASGDTPVRAGDTSATMVADVASRLSNRENAVGCHCMSLPLHWPLNTIHKKNRL